MVKHSQSRCALAHLLMLMLLAQQTAALIASRAQLTTELHRLPRLHILHTILHTVRGYSSGLLGSRSGCSLSGRF
jgi:hypothetical protein